MVIRSGLNHLLIQTARANLYLCTMRPWIAVGILYCIACSTFAQSIQSSSSAMFIGPTFETQTDSVSCWLRNLHPIQTIIVTPEWHGLTYGQQPFSVDQAQYGIPPQDSVRVWVRFRPRHNILQKSHLIFKVCSIGECPGGHLRITVTGQGRYSNSYYQSTENLSDKPLRNALKTRIVSPYNSLSYNAARDFMFMTLDNKATNGQGAAVSTLQCVYTNRTITGYTSRTQAQNMPMNFNTEHTWPQSLFGSSVPMQSDLFHLFPTDNPANGSRANFAFGTATLPYQSVSINQPSKLGSNNLYEPQDSHKGDVARAMMYFVLRYQNYDNYFTSQQSILRSWHFQFPPDSVERKRCTDIQTQQNNRNPFIDYPQFVERIASFTDSTPLFAPAWGVALSGSSITFSSQSTDTTWFYDFHVINTGNQLLSLSNFMLTGTSETFESGGIPVSLQPGDAHTVRLRQFYNAGNPPTGTRTLSFSTNAPGQSLISIPVTNQAALSYQSSNSTLAGIQVFPNPAEQLLWVSLPSPLPSQIDLFAASVQGKRIWLKKIPAGLTYFTVGLGTLDGGHYYLQFEGEVLSHSVPFQVVR